MKLAGLLGVTLIIVGGLGACGSDLRQLPCDHQPTREIETSVTRDVPVDVAPLDGSSDLFLRERTRSR